MIGISDGSVSRPKCAEISTSMAQRAFQASVSRAAGAAEGSGQALPVVSVGRAMVVWYGRCLRGESLRKRGLDTRSCLMKAIVVNDEAAGTAGMALAECPEPTAAINDVIVEVHASGWVSTELEWPSTWIDRAGRGRAPSILGHELDTLLCGEARCWQWLHVGARLRCWMVNPCFLTARTTASVCQGRGPRDR